MASFNPENGETRENLEKGRNIKITLKFLRHGERDKEGNLTDYGREATKQRAQESGLRDIEFDAIKAIGSSAGASSGQGMRAFETANIYAQEVSAGEALNSRIRDVLSYETLKNPMPYNHREIYNANLPENFDSLDDEAKVEAAKKAQRAVLEYSMSLNTPEADALRREAAGAFAGLITHYQKMSHRLNSDSKILIPAGTHGGTMEILLQQAMVRKDDEGKEVIGFDKLDAIGGEFNPSEAYNVMIETDENGDDKELRISFDDGSRPGGDLRLDPNKLKELSQYYEDLHKENK